MNTSSSSSSSCCCCSNSNNRDGDVVAAKSITSKAKSRKKKKKRKKKVKFFSPIRARASLTCKKEFLHAPPPRPTERDGGQKTFARVVVVQKKKLFYIERIERERESALISPVASEKTIAGKAASLSFSLSILDSIDLLTLALLKPTGKETTWRSSMRPSRDSSARF